MLVAGWLVQAPAGEAPAESVSATLDRIRKSNTIVIGHRESSIPLSYLADGVPVGYSLDVCRRLAVAIARRLELKDWHIDFKLVTSANRLDAVQRGDIDLECGSTTNTAERRTRVAFTVPHFVASARLMVQSAKPYERIEDLDGKSIASTAGTTNIVSLGKEAVLKGITLNVVAAKDHAEAVSWVLAGQVEAFAMDDVLLFGLRAVQPEPAVLKVIGKPITIEPYSIAFARGDARLKAIIDVEMRHLIASGEIHALYEKWFVNPIPPRQINLGMRMPYLLRDSLKYPSDYVP